jgi:uncharacterized membrane protein
MKSHKKNQMNKILIVSVFVLFIGYTIAQLFVEIPKVFNNIFFGIITVFAVYFGMFHTEIGKGIKSKFEENRSKIKEKK